MFNITIREMKIKTTMRYHLIPVRMAIIKKSTNNKWWRGVWKKKNPLTLLVGMQTDTITMENSMEIPLKIRNKTIIQPSNPTTGHTPWGNHNWKRHMYPNVHCGIIYNSWDMEATYMSIDRWMDKEAVVRMYNGILLSHQKECIWISSNRVHEPRAY